MSLSVCVWAMLPDSNKMMMMMMIFPPARFSHSGFLLVFSSYRDPKMRLFELEA